MRWGRVGKSTHPARDDNGLDDTGDAQVVEAEHAALGLLQAQQQTCALQPTEVARRQHIGRVLAQAAEAVGREALRRHRMHHLQLRAARQPGQPAPPCITNKQINKHSRAHMQTNTLRHIKALHATMQGVISYFVQHFSVASRTGPVDSVYTLNTASSKGLQVSDPLQISTLSTVSIYAILNPHNSQLEAIMTSISSLFFYKHYRMSKLSYVFYNRNSTTLI